MKHIRLFPVSSRKSETKPLIKTQRIPNMNSEIYLHPEIVIYKLRTDPSRSIRYPISAQNSYPESRNLYPHAHHYGALRQFVFYKIINLRVHTSLELTYHIFFERFPFSPSSSPSFRKIGSKILLLESSRRHQKNKWQQRLTRILCKDHLRAMRR